MVMGNLLVIHHEVAVFSANAIRLAALEKLRLWIGSPVSGGYLCVGETGKEKTVLWNPTSFTTSPSNGPVMIHILTFRKERSRLVSATDSLRRVRVTRLRQPRSYYT